MRSLEGYFSLALIVFVSIAMGWVLWPFLGAILWGTILAMMFSPLNKRLLLLMPSRVNLSAAVSMAVVVVVVILPMIAIGTALLQEATTLYGVLNSGEIDLGKSFATTAENLPQWTRNLLYVMGVQNLDAVVQKITFFLKEGTQFLTLQILSIGQSALHLVISFFVMLYLLFFLLRDGDRLFATLKRSIPLKEAQQDALFDKFVTVVRATVKGDLLVALLQGVLGGLAFWALDIRAPLVWGVLMAVVSLLPAFGAALIWLPVAIYLLISGSIWQGIALIVFGTLVIGLVDNFLRPILVGKDTKMPEYVVLISTLGGLEAFGLIGFIMGPLITAMFLAVWDIRTHLRDKPFK
jgi:predicted PurR-regulated permease PerM